MALGTTPAFGVVARPSSTQATGSANSGGLNGLSTADFLNLFITQLRNQDPLNPTSSNEFLTQTAQFSQVQGITQLKKMDERVS